MKTHYIKTIQPYFTEVREGRKKFEYRYNDRDFNVGDEVYLQEYNPDNKMYSGEEIRATITYILKDFAGLNKDYCVFSFNITQHISKHPTQLL